MLFREHHYEVEPDELVTLQPGKQLWDRKLWSLVYYPAAIPMGYFHERRPFCQDRRGGPWLFSRPCPRRNLRPTSIRPA